MVEAEAPQHAGIVDETVQPSIGSYGAGDESLGAGWLKRIERMEAAALREAEPPPRCYRVPDAKRQCEALGMKAARNRRAQSARGAGDGDDTPLDRQQHCLVRPRHDQNKP